MGEIEKMTLESESLIDDRLNKLKELMPEVFSESGSTSTNCGWSLATR